MLHVLSVRADLPAVVVIDIQSSSWDIGETEDLDFYAWRAAYTGFVCWCRQERYAGRLSDEFATSQGVVSLFRSASSSESFVHAFERCGASFAGIDVLDLSPALCGSLPEFILGRTTFSLANLGQLPPPDLVFGPGCLPGMKVLLTASDLSDDYGLPIAWETSYEALIGGELPSNRGGYGKSTKGVVEIARPDGTFASAVPDGMSVMYAPLVDEDEEVMLYETSIFETRESVLDRIRLAVERQAKVATLARIVYDRKLLGLSEALRPVSVTVAQDRDRSAFVVRVEFDNEGELRIRDVQCREASVSTERAQLWASETAMRLARRMNIPFLI